MNDPVLEIVTTRGTRIFSAWEESPDRHYYRSNAGPRGAGMSLADIFHHARQAASTISRPQATGPQAEAYLRGDLSAHIIFRRGQDNRWENKILLNGTKGFPADYAARDWRICAVDGFPSYSTERILRLSLAQAPYLFPRLATLQEAKG